MLKASNNPIVYQGSKKKNQYFEGWYFKHVNTKQNQIISFIVGISKSKSDPHSFIQVIQSNPIQTNYIRFPLSDFSATEHDFVVKVNKNTFSLFGCELDIITDQLRLQASLTYQQPLFIKTSLTSPSIMGPFAYIPNMECNHGVASMDHIINGTITINDKTYQFQDEKGYIEKDWGKSFPKRYIWLQSNHFSKPGNSIMASLATIPFGLMSFEGLIVNLVIDQKEYRFATYTFAQVTSVHTTEKQATIIIKQGKMECILDATITNVGELKSPNKGTMNQTIKEGLGGMVHVLLKENNRIIFEDTGYHAGIEIEGY